MTQFSWLVWIQDYADGLKLLSASHKQSSKPPKLKYETPYISGIYVKFECQAPLSKRKATCTKLHDVLATVLLQRRLNWAAQHLQLGRMQPSRPRIGYSWPIVHESLVLYSQSTFLSFWFGIVYAITVLLIALVLIETTLKSLKCQLLWYCESKVECNLICLGGRVTHSLRYSQLAALVWT